MSPLLLSLALATPPPSETGVPTADFPAVGTLYVLGQSGGGAQLCTATLISPTVFLTAAHCVDKADQWWAGGFEVYLLLGPDLDAWQHQERVEAMTRHPDWAPSTVSADIATGTLRRPMEGVDPQALGDVALSSEDVGAPLWLVGWGASARDGSGAGLKRLAEGHLQRLVEQDYVFEEDRPGQSACPGDSGAPILRPRDDGGADLVGVVSWGSTREDLHCGPLTGGPRLDAYLEWVDAQVALAEPVDTGGVEDTGGAVDTGEPGGLQSCACAAGPGRSGGAPALWGLLAAGVLRRRYGQKWLVAVPAAQRPQ